MWFKQFITIRMEGRYKMDINFHICLVSPASPNADWPMQPQPGLAFLASALRLQGIRVSLIDGKAYRLSENDIAGMILKIAPDAVGFSAVDLELPFIKQVISLIPDEITTIVGGASAVIPGNALIKSGADFVISGEGEKRLVSLIHLLKNDIISKDINSISIEESFSESSHFQFDGIFHYIRKNGDSVLQGSSPAKPCETDELPIPAWDLFDLSPYQKGINLPFLLAGKRWAPITTSRGCPYACGFCAGHRIMGRKFRPRPIGHIITEARLLNRLHGIDDLFIQDDTFNADPDHAISVLKAISAMPEEFHVNIISGLRPEGITEELCETINKARVYQVALGIESANPSILKKYNRNINPSEVIIAVNHLSSTRCLIHGQFMLGFPEETVENIKKTGAFAASLKLHLANFTTVTPLSGTMLSDHCLNIINKNKNHFEIHDSSNSYYPDTNKPHHFEAGENLCNISPDQFMKLKQEAYRNFYLNPVRLFKLAFKMPAPVKTLQVWGKWLLLRLFGLNTSPD